MPELVAGDVVTAPVIGEEDGHARVEVEVQLLLLAPAMALDIDALWRIARAVHPAGRAVVAVVLAEGDHIGLRRHGILECHLELGRLVVLDHRVAQRLGEPDREGRVEGDEVVGVVPDAAAPRRRDQAPAGGEGSDRPAGVVSDDRSRDLGQDHDDRDAHQEGAADRARGEAGHAAHRPLGPHRCQTTRTHVLGHSPRRRCVARNARRSRAASGTRMPWSASYACSSFGSAAAA